ncbi:MAG: FAD:protein FMN transferase [Bacteroidales bacterium]|nr:FAD:protein FMN transferase [Bacteroidales bacterium]
MKSFKLFFLAFLLLGLMSCHRKESLHIVDGLTMGTYYRVTYIGENNSQLKDEIDSVLNDICHTFSVFDTNSLISKINKGEVAIVNDDFQKIFALSKEAHQLTDGAFEPTIAPLVNLWGFGRTPAAQDATLYLDSILDFVGFDKVILKEDTIIPSDLRIILDFNAIAKGFAVDKVTEFLQAKGYDNCLVDIGGEVKASGSKNGEPWRVGIQEPTQDKSGALVADYTFNMSDVAIATSGNYRNYKEENGVRYSHIINPKNGCPEKSNLLSVSVLAKDCAIADALATGFMVLGMDRSVEILNQHPEYAAHFIYWDNNNYKTYSTKNFPKRAN